MVDMATVAVTLAAIKNLLKTYPALSAALVNVGVVAAGYFGLHVTPVQLVSFAGVLDVLFGMIVHSNVIPVAKTENTFTVVNPSILTAGRSGPVPGDPVPVETVPNAIVPMESYRHIIATKKLRRSRLRRQHRVLLIHITILP